MIVSDRRGKLEKVYFYKNDDGEYEEDGKSNLQFADDFFYCYMTLTNDHNYLIGI